MTKSLVAAVLFSSAIAFPVSSAWPAASDYAVEPVVADLKSGPGQEVAVRLIHKAGGHPVAGAVIFQTRLDMSPDGMADMTTAVKPAETREEGIYRFKADLTMKGRWLLTFAAKVQGEAETIRGRAVFHVKD